MSALAGNLPDFEEAARALFAGDGLRFDERIAAWPADVKDHGRGSSRRSRSRAKHHREAATLRCLPTPYVKMNPSPVPPHVSGRRGLLSCDFATCLRRGCFWCRQEPWSSAPYWCWVSDRSAGTGPARPGAGWRRGIAIRGAPAPTGRDRDEAQGINHPAVLRAMRTVPRHRFVPDRLRPLAYEDTALPIGAGQTILNRRWWR